jgi:FdhD protein
MGTLDEEHKRALATRRIIRYREGETCPADDLIAREEPLEIKLNGQTLVYLMRLPGEDKLLAAGFCLSEGLLSERGQIRLIRHCAEGDFPATSGPGEDTGPDPGNLVEIEADLAEGAGRFALGRVVRTGCGGADLEREVDLSGIRVESGVVFPVGAILGAPDLLLESQEIFKLSGGTHAAGLFDETGTMLFTAEDVGRHNAVDKVLGYLLMSGASPGDKGLMLSGRLSYEMVLKAARSKIGLVCSVSAPTDLGVEVAEKTGVTLVGFLRGAGFNIYSHPGRVGGG